MYLSVDFHFILEHIKHAHLFQKLHHYFSLKDAFFFLFMNLEFFLSQYRVYLSSEEYYSLAYQDLSIIVL